MTGPWIECKKRRLKKNKQKNMLITEIENIQEKRYKNQWNDGSRREFEEYNKEREFQLSSLVDLFSISRKHAP